MRACCPQQLGSYHQVLIALQYVLVQTDCGVRHCVAELLTLNIKRRASAHEEPQLLSLCRAVSATPPSTTSGKAQHTSGTRARSAPAPSAQRATAASTDTASGRDPPGSCSQSCEA